MSIATGEKWSLHDLYLKARHGHDRLWIGVFGFDPDGRYIPAIVMPNDEVTARALFLGLPDDTAEAVEAFVSDLYEWTPARLSHWRASFASVYSRIEIGGERYTIAGATLQDRVGEVLRAYKAFQFGEIAP